MDTTLLKRSEGFGKTKANVKKGLSEKIEKLRFRDQSTSSVAHTYVHRRRWSRRFAVSRPIYFSCTISFRAADVFLYFFFFFCAETTKIKK